MITSRYSLSTLSHQNRLIVAAGGIVGVDRADQVHRTDIVEIYSSTEGKWLSTKRLPFPRSDSPVVIIQEKCFILGGATAETSLSHITTFEDVETLLLHTTAKEKGSTLKTPRWRKLPAHHPLTSPSSVELNQRLLTTGGSWLKDETDVAVTISGVGQNLWAFMTLKLTCGWSARMQNCQCLCTGLELLSFQKIL